MKTNRKTMLGVAFAVAVIALAGVGYATLSGYTSTMSIDNNAAHAEYLVIKEANDDYSAFLNNVEEKLNTVNTAGTVTWTHASITPVEGAFDYDTTLSYTGTGGAYDAYAISGASMVVDVNIYGAATDTYNLTITPTVTGNVGGPVGVAFILTYKVGTGTEVVLPTGQATTLNSIDSDDDITIQAYLVVPHDGISATSSFVTPNVTDLDLSFLATKA